MLLADFGTSYCKILDTAESNAPRIIATRDLPPDFLADLGTGHNAARRSKRSINELTALARGGGRLINRSDFVLLDCGSRDIKYVRFRHGEVMDMGWNAECGASMGFTIELLATYYQLDYAALPVPSTGFSITCGVLGMSHIFDAVVSGVPEATAVAQFVRGIALNAYRFAQEPQELYLSGGLCDNPLFVASFPCQVHPLGRFVLLEGLLATPQRPQPEAAAPLQG
ncbi:activator of 2-hydroxyglutaryl-CoA dehydratase (HSP70-class ATPase domain)-like protein [Desulfobulbus propionicus DSM 2032]|jgi:activator of 2-hydroxyglutaryl-CoA dehydratase|uniref:Activator of 2-hydroxyglutaryl-CoA dehydratase (HSP70-class ATPase domain)-like protein n=1 Tax=Desulfobulbus propionicus (strain ATCC 33891 / DSM 2032 / VKM B-1956 / 1pr3) TaxID=577650 RepID=A0A7U3YJ10_DESPD|nr:ATPase [Desulfobulbus propionicus]ADW16279.1 activator of 2-hydroxyglutaryl-CoA dehydratase (HSP70-class ATPase domain)-like protein [Desulfobulbus propionicus DSM 2032]